MVETRNSSNMSTGSSNSQEPSTSASSRRPKLETFSGSDSVLRVDLWLNLYEVLENVSDIEKIRHLFSYLTGDALMWYAAEIAPRMSEISWAEVRIELLQRFGKAITNPLVEANQRRLKISENVESYYNDKMRLLRRCEISESDRVALLSDGMPSLYKGYLLCSKLATPVIWLELALQLEKNFKKPPSQESAPSRNSQNSQGRFSRSQTPRFPTAAVAQAGPKGKNTPPSACRICEKAGFPNELHWHKECPRRSQNSGTGFVPKNEARSSSAPPTAQESAALAVEPLTSDQGNFLGGRH